MDTVAAVSRRGDSEGEEGPAVAEFAEQPAKNTKLLATTRRGAGVTMSPPAPLRSDELLQSHFNKSSFVSHSRLIDLKNMTESRVDCSSVDSPGCAPTEQEFMTKPLIPIKLPRRCHGEGPCCGAATAKWRRPAGCQSHSGNGDFNSQASPSTTHRGVLAGPARTTP